MDNCLTLACRIKAPVLLFGRFQKGHHYLAIRTTIYKKSTPLLLFAPLFRKDVHHYFHSHHYLQKKYTTTLIRTTI